LVQVAYLRHNARCKKHKTHIPTIVTRVIYVVSVQYVTMKQSIHNTWLQQSKKLHVSAARAWCIFWNV